MTSRIPWGSSHLPQTYYGTRGAKGQGETGGINLLFCDSLGLRQATCSSHLSPGQERRPNQYSIERRMCTDSQVALTTVYKASSWSTPSVCQQTFTSAHQKQRACSVSRCARSCAGRKCTSVRRPTDQSESPLCVVRADQLIPEQTAFSASTHF